MSALTRQHDAVVIGSGPNGLAAAIALAQAGLSVIVYEGAAAVGGGARSDFLTLPGFLHDCCSAVHPLAAGSPFLGTLPLADYGLEWVHPPAPLAHPLDDGTAVILRRSLAETARGLGTDAGRYRKLLEPLLESWNELRVDLLAPLRLPRRLLPAARFAVHALRSARGLAESRFETEPARALFAGVAAHAMLPLEKPATAAFGLVLALAAHAHGWPFPRGGAQAISDALSAHLRHLGGEIVTNSPITTLDQLPRARAVVCDLTPRQLLALAGPRLRRRYRRALERYRYGPGAFKIDWALDGPIPWTAGECRLAGTVHLGGNLAEIAASERAAWEGSHADKPFVLLAQPTLFDPTRAPNGKHIAWGYCHVPNGSSFSMLDRIEAQIERFAPGFRDRVLARNVAGPATLERQNPNLVGGDINGGAQDIRQLFARPTFRRYRTVAPGVYFCSSSTPPGGGVHGLCGYFAAQTVLRDLGVRLRQRTSRA